MTTTESAPAQPLHIEVVTDTFPPDINGVAMSLGRLCDGLRKAGHRVDVVRPGPSRKGYVGLPWWPLPGYWEIRVGAPWPGQILRRWKKQRPDACYIAIESPLGFSAMRAATKLGIPAIGGFHTHFRQYLHRYGLPNCAERVWRYQQWFHSKLKLTLAPSPEARDQLVTSGFDKVGVLGRGVDCQLFHPSKRDGELRRSWGACETTTVAMIVGRVSSEKNIELAIRAFDRMRAVRPDLVGVVVGDGPAREKLEANHPHIRFTGYRQGEALAACYASADILLFPSETETFGNVLMEGMASGLAVLAYDAAAAAWHGRDGDNCLKVEKGNADDYLEAALRLTDPALRASLGTSARATAEGHSWPAVVADLEAHFRSIL
jgi:glycosyltransferase involved in cell wall biosynthesis